MRAGALVLLRAPPAAPPAASSSPRGLPGVWAESARGWAAAGLLQCSGFTLSCAQTVESAMSAPTLLGSDGLQSGFLEHSAGEGTRRVLCQHCGVLCHGRPGCGRPVPPPVTGLVVSVPVLGSAPLCLSLRSAVTGTVSRISVSPGWINPFVIRECLSLVQVPVLVPRAASTPEAQPLSFLTTGALVPRLSLPPLNVFALCWRSSLFYFNFFKVLVFSNPCHYGARTHKPLRSRVQGPH